VLLFYNCTAKAYYQREQDLFHIVVFTYLYTSILLVLCMNFVYTPYKSLIYIVKIILLNDYFILRLFCLKYLQILLLFCFKSPFSTSRFLDTSALSLPKCQLSETPIRRAGRISTCLILNAGEEVVHIEFHDRCANKSIFNKIYNFLFFKKVLRMVDPQCLYKYTVLCI
jgi:hypothetical protein